VSETIKIYGCITGSPPPHPAARQHLMVLHPRLPKTTLLTASIAPLYQVMSSPNYEPIAFSNTDRYEA